MSVLGYNSTLTQTSIRSGLILESELSTVLSALRGKDDTSCLVVEERDEGKRGDTLKIRFAKINANELPKAKGATILGAESDTNEYENSVQMRYFSFDGKVENLPAEQNLVSFNLVQREVSRIALQWAYWFERGPINHLVGNTLANTLGPDGTTVPTDYNFSAGNAVVAQDSAHIYLCKDGSGNAPANEQSLSSANILTSRSIDDLITQVTSRAYVKVPMVPCDTPFGRLFILLVHGTGYQQIRTNSSSSDMYDLSKAALTGGLDINLSPLITGEGFIMNNTLVLRSDFLPQALNSGATAYQANTRTAAFLGARAGHWLFGEGYTDGDHIGYSEHMQHRRLSIMTDTVCGFNRNVVDGESWASVRVVHYSAV